MKIRREWMSATALVALGSFGLHAQDENIELEARVSALETELQAVTTYLQASADAAKATESALSASEAAGFTYGINAESREILLKAWRKEIGVVSTNVPGKKATTEE